MQLKNTPAEKEYKEKVNRKIKRDKKREEKEIRVRDCIEALSAA
jgi:hypothetical protein